MKAEKREKINILFVLPNFDTGGSEKLVFDIIKHLDKTRFSPVLCVFFSGTYEKEFLKLNIPFYIVNPNGQRRTKVQIVTFLNRIMRDHKIHIVNTHHTSSLLQGLISYKMLNRSKLIHTEHTRLNLDPNVTPRILSIQKVFMRLVDVSLGISQDVCDYCERELGVLKRKIVKISNGVDVDRFKFDEEKEEKLKKEYRASLNINNNDVTIGMFANFRKQKNQACLIKAANVLKNRGIHNFKIVLAGNGPELENVVTLAGRLQLMPSILFLGSRLDIPELMNVMDIYCLPSFFEGLPFSLIEAMAAGRAIVATDVTGNNEVVLHDKTGILIRSDDPDMLAEALARLIKDRSLRRELGEQAKKSAQDFSFNKMMNNYEELFTGLIKS